MIFLFYALALVHTQVELFISSVVNARDGKVKKTREVEEEKS